ncbi:MAG: exonuclease domain-containing protein, partial [Bacteroidales bacterium]|nr:exonuclease domain-containing protein [Bacteroidales bacterium]
MKYAIVDIETTGLNYRSDRITEIAILVHNGKEIIHEFISLVNPEKRIPYRIRELTGISDSMVEMAPRFCEIARDIVEITDDCIFVAHNASFDYHFIRQEFKNLGYNYERKTICTKKLSRKLLPDIKKYGLGHLCKELEITVNHRHRAFGDANATVLLFEHLLTLEKEPENISLREIASNIPKEKLQALPEEAGIYYLYNDKQKIIYIGKSTNIRARIFQHMSNNQTKRAIEMRDQSYDVSYELTGSE